MTEPDELYTVRAQFWLGHYGMCVEEAKAVARRPMSASLKQEREEFLWRAYLSLGQYEKVQSAGEESPGLKALYLRAQYEQAANESPQQEQALDGLKSLAASSPTSSVQLTAAQVFFQHGLTKNALQCVHLGVTMEHILFSLQLYLKMDRLDMANEALGLLQQADEDSILTQLGSVYVLIATGSSKAADAIHSLTSLSEQYGTSPFLLNLMAASYMVSSQYEKAEGVLLDCRREFAANSTAVDADTLINLIVCFQQQNKDWTETLKQLQEAHPQHVYCQGVARVEGALEREAVKYRV